MKSLQKKGENHLKTTITKKVNTTKRQKVDFSLGLYECYIV